jgi:hypothetical protein
VAAALLPPLALLAFLTLPRAVRLARTLAAPMPAGVEEAFRLAKDQIPRDLREKYDPTNPDSPATFPLWPLWFVVWGVWWVRHAGGALVLGLVAAVIRRACAA